MSEISALPDRPAVDERAPTLKYLPPVYCGIRVPPWPADREIPPWPVCQDDVSTLDLRVRTAAPNASGADTPAAHVSASEGARCDMGGLGVLALALAALITGCTNHDFVFSCGLMSGLTIGSVVTCFVLLVLDRGES